VDNYQHIKATYETDYDYVNNGWYKTDGKIIIPLEHQHYFGPSFSIGLIIITFGISAIIYLIILTFILIKIFKKRKINSLDVTNAI
jgi:hypothetical protein